MVYPLYQGWCSIVVGLQHEYTLSNIWLFSLLLAICILGSVEHHKERAWHARHKNLSFALHDAGHHTNIYCKSFLFQYRSLCVDIDTNHVPSLCNNPEFIFVYASQFLNRR
jgi:hypothetical protein